MAASLLAYLSSSSSSSLSQEDRNAFTEKTRDLVRRLGRFRVAELAGPDVEAEKHAREHGEDVIVPQEIQDQKEMDSLEDSLAGMNRDTSKNGTLEQHTKPYEELQACKRELQDMLQHCGLNVSLD